MGSGQRSDTNAPGGQIPPFGGQGYSCIGRRIGRERKRDRTPHGGGVRAFGFLSLTVELIFDYREN